MPKKNKHTPVGKSEQNVYEGNLYDKIFKENAEEIFMPLVEARLGIKIKKFIALPTKMQTTTEREVDFFYEVTTDSDKVFILHLEFQTDDDDEMVYRMSEYHGIALRRKRLPIRHIVIFLGKKRPTMKTKLNKDEVYEGFDLINIHDLDAHTLLSSQMPKEVLLAILADFPEGQTETILRFLVRRLRTLSKTPTELSQHLKQLVILARLRKIEDLTLKIAEEMPITYDIETDYFYKKSIEKGIEKGMSAKDHELKYHFVASLLENTDFDDDKIAFIAGVEFDFVAKIRESLIKKSDAANQ